MATSGVNVLRYSALITGVLYGFQHQSTLTKQQRTNETNREYQGRESLIAEAKAVYLQKTLPADKQTKRGGVITNPDDPKFDLEAYFTMKMADETK